MSSRREMLAFLSLSRLPAEFQEVEYLESDGTQYIDSAVDNDGYKSETLLAWNVIGSRQIMGSSTVGFFGINSSGYYEIYQVSTYQAQVNRFDKVVFEVAYTANGSVRNLIVNDVSVLSNITSSTFPANRIYIFAISPTASTFCNCKLKYQKIWNTAGVLIRNFVPCYRKADNVAGLYDLVNGVFYTNAGTGDFIVGGNV